MKRYTSEKAFQNIENKQVNQQKSNKQGNKQRKNKPVKKHEYQTKPDREY